MEHKTLPQPLLLERLAHWAAAQIRENLLSLLSSGIFGILAYFFAFTNKLVNHDEVHSLFSKGATVESGRWGLGALDSLFPNYSMPWIYGVLTVAIMAVAICLILRIFRIQNRTLQVLLSGCILVFPSLIGTFGYMFTSPPYALSFLLAVVSVWAVQRENKWYLLPALGCLVLSVSIYQSYIAIAASLLVLVLMRQLLDGAEAGRVLKNGIFYVVFLVAALAAYFAATQVVFRITGTSFGAYASDNLTLSLSTILSGAALAYRNFLAFFTDRFHGLIPTPLSQAAHFACLAAGALLLVLWLVSRTRKDWGRIALMLLLTALLPLAVNCMYMITSAASIHTLVLYGFAAFYIFCALLADRCLTAPLSGRLFRELRCIACNLLPLALALVLTINIYTANRAYLNLHLRYENAYAFYSSVLTELRQTPGFDENTQLAILGTYEGPDFYEEQFADISAITGVKGFLPDSYSAQRFLEYYLGTELPFASPEVAAAIAATEEYRSMPCYPYYGSVKKFGNTMVVKLS